MEEKSLVGLGGVEMVVILEPVGGRPKDILTEPRQIWRECWFSYGRLTAY